MKKALAFSGGKDSWACLWLLKDQLDDVLVIWVDTGKNIPEVLETIEQAKLLCPNFLRIESDREGQNRAHGIPAEVVPIDWTELGQQLGGAKPVMIQSYLQCCLMNISIPLHQVALANGVTHLMRGQKLADAKRGLARNGTVVDGIIYCHPIENWSDEDVLAFCSDHMVLPEHFQFKHSSVDCYDCTGFKKASEDKIAFLQSRHPNLHSEYAARAKAVAEACEEALQ